MNDAIREFEAKVERSARILNELRSPMLSPDALQGIRDAVHAAAVQSAAAPIRRAPARVWLRFVGSAAGVALAFAALRPGAVGPLVTNSPSEDLGDWLAAYHESADQLTAQFIGYDNNVEDDELDLWAPPYLDEQSDEPSSG